MDIVEEMPTRDARSVYDWDSMVDGKPRRMVRGKDFHCKPRSLRSAALAYARRRGLNCQVRMLEDGVYVMLEDERSEELTA